MNTLHAVLKYISFKTYSQNVFKHRVWKNNRMIFGVPTFAVLVLLMSTSNVTSRRACSRNTNLMKSIQYQLKLVETNEGHCECNTKLTHDIVAFFTKNRNSLANIAAKAKVVYDEVVTNLGNGYDSTTGIFTAPTDGVYSFSWTVLCHTKKNFYTYLTLNGKRIARNYSSANNVSDHTSATQTVILQMKRNDKVYIIIQEGHTGQYMFGDGWSTFSGFRL